MLTPMKLTPILDAQSPAVLNFVKAAQSISQKNLEEIAPNMAEIVAIDISVQEGPRYLRIVRRDRQLDTGALVSGSAHCFIDRTTGDVLKPAGWKSPAKHARGNVLAADGGVGALNPYGVRYL
jgi:hypothetical protein